MSLQEYKLPFLENDQVPSNWKSIKYRVEKYIREMKLSPIFNDMIVPEKENEPVCAVCFGANKDYPLNLFNTCCAGKLYFCTLCLLQHKDFDINSLTLKCPICTKTFKNEFKIVLPPVPPVKKKYLFPKAIKRPSEPTPNSSATILKSKTPQAPVLKEPQNYPPNIPDQSVSYREVFKKIGLPVVEIREPPPRLTQIVKKETSEEIRVSKEREERIMFERQIRQELLDIYNQYDITIPIAIPVDLINEIDISLIEDKQTAEIMLDSVIDNYQHLH
ncbi:hypothetical protein ENUP19_0339G0027 [Entamoeba nuttalli]|uniref:RING-type domain-containing protein n=2 Tax=Entamoeba nuttalli TaxID=412467 RepID=K2HU98_ENTNP|nr:hypothetical protein ENU1_115630 [Entamoeba nuttalli P19]EKE39765.1 hypothetical protein ENU1_115630 [Entamoeba nuttalli P19]|eukprot:XP_008857905.1 hypothetical protein ENU1_115630 [Entamoeba nuttalli P19]